MKTTLQLVFLLFLCHALAQEKKPNRSFEEKRDHIEQFANSHTDAAFIEVTALMGEAKKSGSKAQLAKAESSMALVKIYLTAIEEAKKFNEKSLKFHQAANDAAELAKNHFNLGLISERESDYVNSIKNFFKAISFAEKSKSYILLQKSYRGLAMSYLDQQNFDKALEYCQKSLDYQRFKKDDNQKAYALAAVGEVYRLKGDLTKANHYFQTSFDQFKAAGNEFGQGWVLTNWGLCFQDDLIRLTEMSLKAQKIWDRVGPENTMSIMNLGNIGYNYMLIACNDSLVAAVKSPDMPKTAQSLLDESEAYIRRCLAIAKKKKNRNAMMHHGANLSGTLYVKKDYKSAYDELNRSFVLYDSLYSQENKNKIAALESEKEILLRDEKIRMDKLVLANKEKQKWYFIGGIVLLGVIGLLLFNQSRNRRKNNEKLQTLNADLDQANKTNARFFSILNHDLRSPVYNLIHYLTLQKDSPELLDAGMRKSIEAKNMAAAENLLESMEDMLLWSKGQMENFKPQPENIAIQSVFEDIGKHFSSEEKVRINFQNPQDLHLFTDANYLKTIMRNLTGNAIKVLLDAKNPEITWKAWAENGQNFLAVMDNGPGGTKEQFRALYDDTEVIGINTGLGLHLIRDLAKAINCTVSVNSEPGKGTTFTLAFP